MIRRNQLIGKFACILPYLFIMVVISAFIFIYFTHLYNILNYAILISIPILLASVFLLKVYDSDFCARETINLFSVRQERMLLYFTLVYLISILTLFLSLERSYLYFISVILLYILVFVQVFNENFKTNFILLEIILLTLNFTYGVTLKYPLYFGYTDLLIHSNLAEITYNTGHTVPDNIIYYSSFPLYHIFVAESSYVLNLDAITSLFVVTAPVFAILIVFLYYIFLSVTKNSQISILACLLYSSSSIVLFSGTYVVTRTMAFWGLIILLYSIYKQNPNVLIYFKYRNCTKLKANMTYCYLSILFSAFIILVHQVSSIFVLIILTLLLLCEYLINGKRYLNVHFIILYAISFIGYWFFEAYNFTSTVLSQRVHGEFLHNLEITQNTKTVASTSSIDSVFSLFFDKIDIYIFLFFALIGIGYTLFRQKPKYSAVFGLCSLLMLIFYVPNPLHTMWFFYSLLALIRMKLFVSPFVFLMMGIGIVVFLNYAMNLGINKQTNKILYISLVTLLLFNSVVYSVNDSNVFQQNTSREYFTTAEINGFEFITSNSSQNTTIYSDYHFKRIMETTPQKVIMLSGLSQISDNKGYFVVRTTEFLENGLNFNINSSLPDSGTYLFEPISSNIIMLETNVSSTNKIYSNNDLDLYYAG